MAVHLHQPDYRDRDGRFWSRLPNVEVVMRGMKLTWPGQATPVWTENAAAIRYWLERNRAGVPEAAFDLPSFTAAYDLCEETVDITLPADLEDYTASGLRYRANGVVTDGMGLDDVRGEVDWAWQGWAVEAGGVLYFRPGGDRTAAYSLGAGDVTTVKAVKPAPALQDRVNALSMQLNASLDHDFLQYDVPEIEDAPALMRDDDFYLPQHTGTRLFVNGPVDAARLMTVSLRRNRASLTLDCTCLPGPNLELFGLIPSDIVTLTLPEYGFSAQRFLVSNVTVLEDMSVKLTLDEEELGAYVDDLTLPPLMPRPIIAFLVIALLRQLLGSRVMKSPWCRPMGPSPFFLSSRGIS